MSIRFAVIVALLVSAPVFATVIEVPSNEPSIQAAVDAAASGDTVLVAAGWYDGIVHVEKTLVIRSFAGPASTRLNGGFVLDGGPSAPPTGMPMGIEGFTIVGAGNLNGIDAVDVALDLRDCIVTECVGHGAQLSSAEYRVGGCVFAGNGSNGILLNQSILYLSDSTITGNSGTGLRSIYAQIALDGCLLAFNGGYGCLGSSYHQFDCTDIYGNDSGDWYTDIAGQQWFNGNMSYDPLFCADDPAAEMDFTVDEDSPCAVWPALCDTIGFGAADCSLAAVTDDAGAPPRPARLVAAAPNPFNPSTTISLYFDLPQHARVAVHDPAGRFVAVLADREFTTGTHEIVWRGVDDRGRALSSGVYFVRLMVGNSNELLKISLIR